jgi:hypothetical protein
LQTTNVPLRLSWSATDPSGVTAYALQQSKNGGSWTTLTLATPTTTATTRFRPPGNYYRYRVRATDGKGNTSAYVYGPTFKLVAKQETSTFIVYSGSWTHVSSSTAYGGALNYAKSSTARATLTFTGRSVAWVAPRNTTRGIADVYVDGVFAQSIDLFAASLQPRMTVFTRSWTTSTTHTLQVRVKATLTRPRIDIDAFVFLK